MAELDADDQRRIIEAALPGPGPAPPLLFRYLVLAQTLSDSMPATMASGITVTTNPALGA